MSEENPIESASLEELYVRDETVEKELFGVNFEFRELSGEDLLNLVSGCTLPDGSVDKVKYAKSLFKRAILKPKELDVGRLKATVLTQLIQETEAACGLGGDAIKNFATRSEDIQPFTE